MRACVVALALALALGSERAAAQTVTLGDGVRSREVALPSLPRSAIEVRDPTDGGRRKRLTGVALGAVLAELPAPSGADAVAVRCHDGWFALVRLATVVRFPDAILALAEGKSGAEVPLAPPRGPIFLAWPNLAHPEVDHDGDGDGDGGVTPSAWSFGVATLEYVRASDFVVASPVAAGKIATRGGALFRSHCQPCHALSGVGGGVGWDLAKPPVRDYRSERYLNDYIVAPRRTNPAAHMPPFRGRLRPSEIAALVAYLRALSK